MCGHVVQRAAVKLLHADCNNLMVRAAGSITGSRWWPPTSGERFTSFQIFFGISKYFFLQKANIFIFMCCPGRGRCWARVRSTCPGTGSSGRTPGRRAWSVSGCWRRRASRRRWSSSCSTCSSTRSSSSTSGLVFKKIIVSAKFPWHLHGSALTYLHHSITYTAVQCCSSLVLVVKYFQWTINLTNLIVEYFAHWTWISEWRSGGWQWIILKSDACIEF